MKSRAVVQVGDEHLELQEIEIPRIRDDEALLRIESCGLCGSDVEQFRGHLSKNVKYPVIPGHEPIGIIEGIGSEATERWGVKVGERVAIEPNISCGLCARCLSGAYNLCRNKEVSMSGYGFLPLQGEKGLWGGYSEYLHLLPRTILHRVPLHMPLELASLYQMLASGLQWAVEIPRTAIGDSVLILGCGQRGLGSVVACREAGAAIIIVTGLAHDRHKLDLALTLGATHVIVADQEDVVARVMEITSGSGVHTAVDVVPVATHPIAHAMDVVMLGGTIVLAGLKGDKSRTSLDTDRIVLRQIRLQGVLTQTNGAYRRALQMLEQNKYDLGRLHTHSFGLDQAEKGIRTLAGEFRDSPAISVSLIP